jgi:hypothetical protein
VGRKRLKVALKREHEGSPGDDGSMPGSPMPFGAGMTGPGSMHTHSGSHNGGGHGFHNPAAGMANGGAVPGPRPAGGAGGGHPDVSAASAAAASEIPVKEGGGAPLSSPPEEPTPQPKSPAPAAAPTATPAVGSTEDAAGAGGASAVPTA